MRKWLLAADIIGDLLRRLAVAEVAKLALLLRCSDASEKIRNFVRVHARSGHLDGTCPVEVVVAQSEGQLLDLNFRQVRLIEGHKEVSRTHASLSALHRHEEEIELSVRGLFSGDLDQLTIDDAAARRVLESVVVVHNEEGLDNPLIDDHEGNLGRTSCLIVQFAEGVLKLSDLLVDDLHALCGTHTITVDDNVSGKGVLVVPLEQINCFFDAFLDLGSDNLLTLLLHNEVRVVLGHLLVDWRCRASLPQDDCHDPWQ